MIKLLAIILTLVGILGLITGILGVFGNNLISLNPLAVTILGGIFFFAGTAILQKNNSDTKKIR